MFTLQRTRMIHWKKDNINLGYVPGRVASDSKPLAIVLCNNPIHVVYPAWTTSAEKKREQRMKKSVNATHFA